MHFILKNWYGNLFFFQYFCIMKENVSPKNDVYVFSSCQTFCSSSYYTIITVDSETAEAFDFSRSWYQQNKVIGWNVEIDNRNVIHLNSFKIICTHYYYYIYILTNTQEIATCSLESWMSWNILPTLKCLNTSPRAFIPASIKFNVLVNDCIYVSLQNLKCCVRIKTILCN